MIYVICVPKNGLKFWKTIHISYHTYKDSLKYLTGIYSLDGPCHSCFRVRNSEINYFNSSGLIFFLNSIMFIEPSW